MRTPEETIREYYDALRAGGPLHPFFVDRGPVVKVGIGEQFVGADAVTEGLREQTETTAGWEVESRCLEVGVIGAGGEREGRVEDDVEGRAGRDGATDEGDRFAWFFDEVFMAWTDTERNVRFEFETRWSGALVRRGGEWRFVEMHVSTPGQT